MLDTSAAYTLKDLRPTLSIRSKRLHALNPIGLLSNDYEMQP